MRKRKQIEYGPSTSPRHRGFGATVVHRRDRPRRSPRTRQFRGACEVCGAALLVAPGQDVRYCGRPCRRVRHKVMRRKVTVSGED